MKEKMYSEDEMQLMLYRQGEVRHNKSKKVFDDVMRDLGFSFLTVISIVFYCFGILGFMFLIIELMPENPYQVPIAIVAIFFNIYFCILTLSTVHRAFYGDKKKELDDED